MKPYKILPMKEFCEKYGNDNDPVMDAAYRRGYMHGYNTGIDDTKAGKKVIKFFNNQLTKWRYGKKPYKPTSEWQQPPWCE
tara:strand:+ start:372 stop:614 length:243 start_codon:yes stop_codon:yes gene_type:complete